MILWIWEHRAVRSRRFPIQVFIAMLGLDSMTELQLYLLRRACMFVSLPEPSRPHNAQNYGLLGDDPAVSV
jgi:hypothetical protein